MIKILGKIPNPVYLAVSGGIDSMTILHFLLQGKREVIPCFFDHGTETSKKARTFLTSLLGSSLKIGEIEGERNKEDSLEEFWRNERYSFFNQFPHIVTCHHLDDVIETWLFSSMNGNPKLMQYRSVKRIHPFLLTTKADIESYAKRHDIKYSVDMSNFDRHFPRNRIRHEIMPHVLEINPGIHKTIARKVKQKYVEQEQWFKEVIGDFLEECLKENEV